MKKTFRFALTVGILAIVPLAYAQFSIGGFGEGTFHGRAVEHGPNSGLANAAGSALTGNGGYGKAFGIDGRPENTGFGFFAVCLALSLALSLALFLLPVWLLKRHHRTRQGASRTIKFLPFSASFHLADSGETIGKRKSVPEGGRDGGLTFRPFSFP